VIVTPGQDTALTIRNTLLGGRRGGVFTAVGISSGQLVWTLTTAVGISALLVASQPAFVALKLLGSAYLVYLGAHALAGALGRRGPAAPLPRGSARLHASTAFRQGLLSNLGNPKSLAFFTSLLPQFGRSVSSLLPLGLVFCALTLAWLSGYAVVVGRAGDVLRRGNVRRALDGVTGAVLVALGLRLATAHRPA
jgi:threonine/homoserine/homoserine lactone efflux protein